MHDSSTVKRDRILQAAAELFIEHGFERTTLAMIATASGAAVGSITHFFDDKAGLATAVHDAVAERFLATAETALRGHKTDVPAAVRALLSACLAWDEASPHHLRLMNKLAACMREPAQLPLHGVPHRLAEILAAWARPLIRQDLVAPLSPEQLYAVLLGPVISHMAYASGPPSDDRESAGDWIEILTTVAMAAITPPAAKRSSKNRSGERIGNCSTRC